MRNSPLIHLNNKCPDQPAHGQSFRRPLFLESVYGKKSEIPSEFQTVCICRARPGPALSADKNDRDDAPIHPLTEIPGIAHERHTRIKSGVH